MQRDDGDCTIRTDEDDGVDGQYDGPYQDEDTDDDIDDDDADDEKDTDTIKIEDQRVRVVLLLDLDCFYAQAMCLRLGYDATTTPLALFQWNSVLAVTYPARTLYHIQRGDSWDAVRTKSHGHCLCVHVPILTTMSADPTAATSSTTDHHHNKNTINHQSLALSILSGGPTSSSCCSNKNNEEADEVDDGGCNSSPMFGGAVLGGPTGGSTTTTTIEDEYRDYFQLNLAQQQQARQQELGVRKYNNDGKASIECFRIASARILSLVKSFLREQYKGCGVIILERASIDEFFLDVTAVVATSSVSHDHNNQHDSQEQWSRQSVTLPLPPSTIVVGEPMCNNTTATATADVTANKTNDPTDIRLVHGCIIAERIRAHVREELNFTLTAGVSINKTLAKLAASYGKPNGQAVCYPRHIATLLQATPINKCRNLGGKLGALVEKVILSESSTTTTTTPTITGVSATIVAPPPAMVGDIVQRLSLPCLLQCGYFSNSTARWIWNIGHGRDHEPVQAKDQTAVLTKSITAFKSMNFGNDDNGHLLRDIEPWVRLLAQEVVDRVTRDAQRNHRYPKSCLIQYTTTTTTTMTGSGGGGGNIITNSVSKSVRIPFPSARWSSRQKQDHLVAVLPKTVAAKERDRQIRLRRIGICATDFFEHRSAGTSIGRFFTEEACSAAVTAAAITSKTVMMTTTTAPPPGMDLEQGEHVTAPAPATATDNRKRDHDEATVEVAMDRDLALARSLQAKYDREEQTLRRLESRKRKKSAGCIDSFFSRRGGEGAAAANEK